MRGLEYVLQEVCDKILPSNLEQAIKQIVIITRHYEAFLLQVKKEVMTLCYVFCGLDFSADVDQFFDFLSSQVL